MCLCQRLKVKRAILTREVRENTMLTRILTTLWTVCCRTSDCWLSVLSGSFPLPGRCVSPGGPSGTESQNPRRPPHPRCRMKRNSSSTSRGIWRQCSGETSQGRDDLGTRTSRNTCKNKHANQAKKEGSARHHRKRQKMIWRSGTHKLQAPSRLSLTAEATSAPSEQHSQERALTKEASLLRKVEKKHIYIQHRAEKPPTRAVFHQQLSSKLSFKILDLDNRSAKRGTLLKDASAKKVTCLIVLARAPFIKHTSAL